MSSAPGYLALLQNNAPFRWLWLGVVVSFFGDWFSTIALYEVAEQLSGRAGAIATILIAKSLPIFLVSPIAGPLIDRFDRRNLLIVTDVARSLLTLAMVAAWWAESFPAIIAFVVLKVVFSGIFIPGRTAVIPQVTSFDELPVAMALSGGTWSVMLAFGAALGGLVTAGIGVTGALVLDAITFLVSAAFLARLPALPPQPDKTASQTSSFLEGLRYLRGRSYLTAVLLGKAGLAVTTGALVTLPAFGNGLFPETAGPAFVGLLYAARGVGAMMGSLGTRRIVGDDARSLAFSLVPGYLTAALGLAGVSLAPTLAWAAGGYVVNMVGHATVWVFTGILAQRATPQGLRGRLFAMEFGLLTLISASASFLAGHAIDTFGYDARQVTGAVAGLMTVPAGLFSLVLLTTGVREDRT
ncbi:MAG: MFS transporter [Myxococcota bacterium]